MYIKEVFKIIIKDKKVCMIKKVSGISVNDKIFIK